MSRILSVLPLCLSIFIGVLPCFSSLADASPYELANVDYVHQYISYATDLSVDINESEVLRAVNIKYLLATIDELNHNNSSNGSLSTNYHDDAVYAFENAPESSVNIYTAIPIESVWQGVNSLFNCNEAGYYKAGSINYENGLVNDEDGTGKISCQICTSGHYCPAGNEEQIPCEPGNYCLEGATKQTACSNWSYSFQGSDRCTDCISPESGWSIYDSTSIGWSSYTSCKETKNADGFCSAGILIKTQNNADAWGSLTASGLKAKPGAYLKGTTCLECPYATYNADETATFCTKCPELSICTDCVYGGWFYWPYTTNRSDYTSCWQLLDSSYVSSYCLTGGKIFRQAISATEWGPSKDATGFNAKPGAYVVNGNNCLPCEAGTYNNHSMSTTCVKCPKDHYCPAESSTPTECPAGKITCTTGAQDVSDCHDSCV